MNIVHVITGLGIGGAELMLLRLSKQLRSKCSQVVVCLGEAGPIEHELKEAGISVEILNLNFSNFPFQVFRLWWIIRKYQPDLVQTWLYHADLLGGIFAYLAGCRVVVWGIHNNDLSPDKMRWSTRLVSKISAFISLYLPKKIICCSHSAVQTHVDYGYTAQKFHVIPNGFEVDLFFEDSSAKASVCNELGLNVSETRFIACVARFDIQKNHQGFIDAASYFYRTYCYQDVHFLLIGKEMNFDNRKLFSWIESAGLIDYMHLLDERNDIARLMAACDIVSLASWNEAFPNVLGEAMSCGAIAVSTDVGDARLILGGQGFLVPVGDMLALAKAWQKVLDLNDTERQLLKIQAKQHIRRSFEMSVVAEQYYSLYQSLAFNN